MTRAVGIDIGSRTIKRVVVEDGAVLSREVRDTTHDPLAVCRELLEGVVADRRLATGYGRHLFREHFGGEVVTEIKAVGIGARALVPTCRTVIDIGGQDTKAVGIDAGGRLHKFTMNDRCAAGTGRFLEVMAVALSYSAGGFVEAALGATKAHAVNSTCAVFAESEVVSLVARGVPRACIALGIHQSVAKRTLSLVRGVRVEDDVLFTGGVARNACLRALLEEGLGRPVHAPEHAQTAAALGCALLALTDG